VGLTLQEFDMDVIVILVVFGYCVRLAVEQLQKLGRERRRAQREAQIAWCWQNARVYQFPVGGDTDGDYNVIYLPFVKK
jgi:hypothetical protein